MTREEKELIVYCLKANSDFHGEVCEECKNFPKCDHFQADSLMEKLIKALEHEEKADTWSIKDVADTLAKHGLIAEQEPCEDCISREHLLEEIASLKESPWFKDDTNCAMAIRKEAIEIVEDLCIRKEPSVNPQKIGHWKPFDLTFGRNYYYCTSCEYATNMETVFKYCPNCGAKMVEPKESEDKE